MNYIIFGDPRMMCVMSSVQTRNLFNQGDTPTRNLFNQGDTPNMVSVQPPAWSPKKNVFDFAGSC